MNSIIADPTFIDSRNLLSADATLPALDPLEQMLHEQHRESALLRLVMCAAAAVLLLGALGSVFS